jgi:hypothetical protein
MTQAQLSRLCAKWKKRLGLVTWKTRVRFVRFGNMAGELGRVEFYPEMMRAEISILHPDDRTAKPDERYPELDLVHELLHLLIDGHKGPDKYSIAHERAINAIAEALWKGYRPRRKRKAA